MSHLKMNHLRLERSVNCKAKKNNKKRTLGVVGVNKICPIVSMCIQWELHWTIST